MKQFVNRFLGKSATVVGLGVSNLPLVDFLLDAGADVTVRDQKSEAQLAPLPQTMREKGVRLVLGEDYLKGVRGDFVFRSPGIRPDIPAFAEAVKNGSVLTSEMELFFELCPCPIIGITGSDGKTTSTTITGLLLQQVCKRRGYGKVFVGGNIGEPLLPRLKEMSKWDFAVVELSSFQLQTMTRSPLVSAVTNVTPNHLNWHTGMEEYIQAKTNIYRHSENRMFVTNFENDVTNRLGREYKGQMTWFSSKQTGADGFSLKSGDQAIYARNREVLFWDGIGEEKLLDVSDILLPGTHNLENYMTAAALCREWILPEDLQAVATTFQGVRHRLEKVRVLHGVTFYNSSIDSSPTRTAAALSALKTAPIVICGGYDKHIPFEPLAEALCEHAKAVVLTGATRKKILAALQECQRVKEGKLTVAEEEDFEAAVNLAKGMAKEGDVVLLSPACASFDRFRNFEERGDYFCKLVRSFEK